MPTAGELRIIIEAQDRASRQLQQVAQEVAQLERATERAQQSAGGLNRVFSGIGQGLRAGAGFAAVEVGLQGIHEVFGLVADSVVGMNSRLEHATATFRTFTGSAAEARAIVEELSRNADVTPFDTREVIAAGQALISSAQGSREALLELLRTAEQLAAYRPTEGLEGATFALREALEGDLQSIRERFGLSAQSIRAFQAAGMTALQAVQAEMQRVGATSQLVLELSRTFGGLSSNITSAFAEVRRRLGEGVFDRLKDGLTALNAALDQNREAIYEWATRMGAVIGEVVSRVGGIIGNLAVQLANWIDPGSGDRLRELFSGMSTAVQDVGDKAEQATPQVQQLDRALALPQAREALVAARGNMQALQTLSAETSRPVEQLARDLGAAGLAAAELQFQADRVRDSYQKQLEPLERQLRALQQSAEVQRLQNALASNQGAVRRLQLEREIAALQRAGAVSDPAQENLTPRQRAIAFALQERQIQLQLLGIEEERRPLVQQLQEQIERITEEQRRALEPIQVQIEAQRERINLLQLERQRWEVLRGEIQQAVEAINSAPVQAKTKAPDQAEVDQRKAELERLGTEFGERFQKGWDDWLAAGGGDIWKAIGAHAEQWYSTDGKPLAERIGKDLGTALGTALGTTLPDAIWKAVGERLTAAAGTSAGTEAITEAIRRAFTPSQEAPPLGGVPTVPRLPTVEAGPPGSTSPAPQPIQPLPILGRNVTPGQPPAPVNVNVDVGGLQLEQEGRQARIDELTETLGRDVATAVVDSLIAAEQRTDAGPNALLAGNVSGR